MNREESIMIKEIKIETRKEIIIIVRLSGLMGIYGSIQLIKKPMKKLN